MARIRLVVELVFPEGGGVPERQSFALAAAVNELWLERRPTSTRFFPLVRGVIEPQLDRLRAIAGELAGATEQPFDPAAWMFGGFLAADFLAEPGVEAMVLAPLVEELTELVATGEILVAGTAVGTFWLEPHDEPPPWRLAGGEDRTARDLVDPQGTLQNLPGADGGHPEVSLVVVEDSWELSHPELETRAIRHLSDPQHPPDSQRSAHGVATLGMLVGPGGLIPGVQDLALLSPTDGCSCDAANWTNAVLRALVELKAGDVLLLEQQSNLIMGPADRGNFPPEVFPSVARAIGLATRCGVAVVEPAGNAEKHNSVVGFDSERARLFLADARYTYPIGGLSGAILVGAASPTTDCEAVWTNYGSRVAMKAPGSCVYTTGWWGRERPDPTGYTNRYGLTSAASALVAGAIVVAQAVRRSGGEVPLLPWQLRAVIGTAVKGGDGLGVEGRWPLGAFVDDVLAFP